MDRRHDLDWVRIFAFGMLVLYHVGMYYVTWDWHVNSPHASRTLEPLMLLSSPWRLSLLFFVSGAATAYLFQRSRLQTDPPARVGFLGTRSWRLLLPLVFGMLVIVPPQSYYEVVEKLPGGYTDGYLAFWGRYLAADPGFCRGEDCLALPTWNHLWFLAYLWCYTVALWALLRIAPGLVARASAAIGSALSGAGLLLWPVLFFVLARVLLVGRFESTHALVDDWYNHVQYFGAFLLGFALVRTPTAWDQMAKLRWVALGLALASWAYIAWYFSQYSDGEVPTDTLRMLQRVCWGLKQWTMIVAILGFARRFAPGDSAAKRYLSEAVFPVYILHQTLIVVMARNAKPLDLPPWFEGPMLVVLTFALCFAAYELVRRIRVLRPLFGLKAL
jgi:surface polysaccharide O-acyltransferase-like enzyme